jgi:hypothetical protein
MRIYGITLAWVERLRRGASLEIDLEGRQGSGALSRLRIQTE